MTGLPREEIDGWTSAINQLYDYVAHEPGDARLADEGIGRLWSGFGYREAPPEIIELMIRALETGYAAALRDVRDGRLDNEVSGWRPDLNRE